MTFRILQNRFGVRVFVPFVALALPVPASAGFIEFSGQSAPTQQGTGLGSTHHILELDDDANDADAIESGAITWNGTTDVATTAEVKVPHSNTETFGSLLSLGLEAAATLAGVNGFSLLFDVNEPGGGLATLQDLALLFYAPDGTLLWQFDYTGPDLSLGDDGGVGQAGWEFEVRFTDAEWDFFTDPANANYRVGMSATIADVAGAPENFFVAPAAVPEPSSWALLGLVGGAGAIGRFVRRRKARRDAI